MNKEDRLRLSDDALLCAREIERLTSLLALALKTRQFLVVQEVGEKLKVYTARINKITEEAIGG